MADDTFTLDENEGADKPKEPSDAEPKGSLEKPEGEEKGKESPKEPEGIDEKITAGITKALSEMSIPDLLNHPTLGPKLNSWSDKAGNAQSTAAVTKAEGDWGDEAKLKVLEQKFEDMSEEELGRALQDPETQAAFAALVDRRNKVTEEASEEAVAKKGQLYGYTVQIGVYQEMVGKSGLSTEAKEALRPEKFTHLGAKGIIAWGVAIQEALLEHASDEKSKALLDEKWEAHLEQQLGGDGASGGTRNGADISSGRPRSPITADMLRGMTAQEVMRVPAEQVTQALKEQAVKNAKK